MNDPAMIEEVARILRAVADVDLAADLVITAVRQLTGRAGGRPKRKTTYPQDISGFETAPAAKTAVSESHVSTPGSDVKTTYAKTVSGFEPPPLPSPPSLPLSSPSDPPDPTPPGEGRARAHDPTAPERVAPDPDRDPGEKASAAATVDPASPEGLLVVLRAAVEAAHPELGFWSPGHFAARTAADFLAAFPPAIRGDRLREEIRAKARAFATSGDPWIRKTGFSVKAFVERFATLRSKPRDTSTVRQFTGGGPQPRELTPAELAEVRRLNRRRGEDRPSSPPASASAVLAGMALKGPSL